MKALLQRKEELITMLDRAEKEKNWAWHSLLLEELELIYNKLA